MRILFHRRPTLPCALLAALLGTLSVVPAAADEAEVDAGDELEAAGPDLPEPKRPARALASTEDLYDFTPFSDVDPRYGAVLEAFRKRRFADVVVQAAELASHARAPLTVAALHLQALAHEALRQPDKAERTWQRLAQAGPLAQRARLALARLALARKDVDGALAQLAAVAPWHVRRDEATLEMARLELERGQIGPARDAVDRVQAAALTKDQRALLLLLQGEVAQRAGRTEAAVRVLGEAWRLDAAPHSARAAKRLAELDAAPSPSDQIERILQRRSAKVGQVAAWLDEAAAAAASDAGLRDYVHGALLARDKPTRARGIALLRQATASLTEPTLLGRALYALGDALGKAGDDREAIAVLQRVATLPAAADVQSRTLQRLHRLFNAVNEPRQAELALRQVLDQPADPSRSPDVAEKELVLWGLAWQRFLADDHAGALQHLVQLEREFGHLWTGANQPWRAKAIYWQGRCLGLMGQTEAAIEAWTTVASTWAQTYYGVVALDRIRELDADRAARLQGPPPSAADAGVPPLALDRVRVQRDPALDEAALLVRAGLHADARALLRSQVGQGLPRDGVHLLATLYELQGQGRAAWGVMQRHTRKAARPDDATAAVWRQAFPRPFLTEVSESAQSADITRALLYAIMRHESHFVPTARSKAGAFGLVQLLPGSAKAIAELYGLPVQGIGGLLRPDYNLQVGALYLSQLLSFFRNQQMLAAAAYNAGPYAVQGWVKKHGHLPADAFVESIPYPATRAYVMQVTATAQTYAWLYPEWAEIERDQLSRQQALPKTLGPFMKRPQPESRVTFAGP